MFDSVEEHNEAPPISGVCPPPSTFFLILLVVLFLTVIVDGDGSFALRFPGVTLSAGWAADCDWDRTRQQGKVGGMEQKEGLQVTRLPRSGREDYVECGVNGCRGP